MSKKIIKPLLGAAVASTVLLGPVPAFASDDAQNLVVAEVAADKVSVSAPEAAPEAVEAPAVQKQAPAVSDSTNETVEPVVSTGEDQPVKAPAEVAEQSDATQEQTAVQSDTTDEATPVEEEAPSASSQPETTGQPTDAQPEPSQTADPENTQQQSPDVAEEDPQSPELDVLQKITAADDIKLPEGSENWTDEQWDAYFATPEGEELLEELMGDPDLDESLEMTPQDEELLKALMEVLPSGSEDWSEKQWNDYIEGPEGQGTIFDIYAVLLDFAQTEAEIEETWAAIAEELQDREGWLEAFEEYYFGTESGEETEGEEAQPEPKPSATPEESKPMIKPAGEVKQQEKATAEVAAEPLAETGSNSLLWAGLGGMLALTGAVLVIRQRRNSAS